MIGRSKRVSLGMPPTAAGRRRWNRTLKRVRFVRIACKRLAKCAGAAPVAWERFLLGHVKGSWHLRMSLSQVPEVKSAEAGCIQREQEVDVDHADDSLTIMEI